MTENEMLEKREVLADLCHEQWSGWMKYMFTKGYKNIDGSFTIYPESVERWSRQMNTPYAELCEPEQESAKVDATKFLEIFNG